jgi:predicted ATPase
VDWSYELLDSAEQRLSRMLAVFAGRFDLAAANAMGGPDTLDVLDRLVDKSLVLADPTEHSTRYRLLETLHSYAWDRLRESRAPECRWARKRDGASERRCRPSCARYDGPSGGGSRDGQCRAKHDPRLGRVPIASAAEDVLHR